MDGFDTRWAPRRLRQAWVLARRLQLSGLLALSIALSAGLVACSGSSSEDVISTSTAVTRPGADETTSSVTASTETTSAAVDPLDWPMLGPTVIDVSAQEVVSAIVSSQGGVIEYGPVKVDVPAGALAGDVLLTITRLGGSFNDELPAAASEDTISARPVGSIYDFGPAGTHFEEPVTITLPYDPGMGPDGIDPEQISVAYYNGEYWALAGGTADPQTHTVSVQVRAFEGVSARAVLKSMGAVPFLVGKAIDYEYGPEEEGVDTDAVEAGNASEWVDPDNSVIQTQAAKAVLYDPSTKTTIALDDPALSSWVESSVLDKHMPVLGYKNPDGSVSLGVYDDSKGSNWQKPWDYFTNGTETGGPLHGDCTDITNVAVSIFKAKKIPAKGIYGYADGDTRRTHVWGEVLIGTKVYRIDEDGHLVTPDTAPANFKTYQPPTDPNDPHYNSMWDDTGQRPYESDWWTVAQFAGTYKGTFDGGPSYGDVPLTIGIDANGAVSGGWDYFKSGSDKIHGISSVGSFTDGKCLKDGSVEADGSVEMTVTYSGGTKTQTDSLQLEGKITGSLFEGTLVGANGEGTAVRASRQ